MAFSLNAVFFFDHSPAGSSTIRRTSSRLFNAASVLSFVISFTNPSPASSLVFIYVNSHLGKCGSWDG